MYTIRIAGMTCGSCATAIQQALKNLKGLRPDSVNVDLDTATATFTYDDGATVDQNIVAKAIENTGYDMKSWESSAATDIESFGASVSNNTTTATTTATTVLDQIIVKDEAEPQYKATILISGMTCASCVNTVERALKRLPGVQPDSVTVNLLMGNGTLVFGGSTIDDKFLKNAIEDLGYDVEGVRIVKIEPPTSSRGTDPALPRFRANLVVSGMFCDNCVDKLEKVFAALEGIDRDTIAISLENGTASFEYQGETTNRTLIHDTVQNLGFMADTISIVKEKPSPSQDSAASSLPSLDKGLVTTRLEITGMTCASCVAAVERALLARDGVYKAQVNLLTCSGQVQHDPTVIGARDVVDAVNEIGYEARAVQDTSVQDQRDVMRDRMRREEHILRDRFLWSLLFAVPVLLISMIFMIALPDANPVRQVFEFVITPGLSIGDLVLFLLATPVQFWLGWPFYRKAYRSLVYSRTANMEVLVAMGISAAYVSSVGSVVATMVRRPDDMMKKGGVEFFETSVFLVTFIHLGKWLEALAKGKTAETITKLMDLQPEKATLVRVSNDGEGREVMEETEIEASAIQVGDILKVNPGSRIPCDVGIIITHNRFIPAHKTLTDPSSNTPGKLWRGTALLDESMITGESLPVTKTSMTQDPVVGATINLSSTIYMRAIRVGSDTTLSRIIQLVQDAQASPKAPIEVLADRISAVFVPVVIVLAIGTFVAWFLCGMMGVYPDDWVPEGESKGVFSLMFAVTVLVIACPCGLGLASPTVFCVTPNIFFKSAIMVGTGVAARYGVLAKGGGYALEMANRINTIVFDKTGTLTAGKPVVTASWLLGQDDEIDMAESGSADVLWKVLGLVASSSNHPLSKAIAKKVEVIMFGEENNGNGSDEKGDTSAAEMVKNEEGDMASISDKKSLRESIRGVKLVHSTETPGRGVTATVRLSRDSPLHIPAFGDTYAFTVYLGNQAWMQENRARYSTSVDTTKQEHLLRKWQESGNSIVVVAISPIVPATENRPSTSLASPFSVPTDGELGLGSGSGFRGGTHKCQCECEFCECVMCTCPTRDSFDSPVIVAQLAVADVPRPEARGVIAGLKARGVDVWMITGDNAVTAKAVAGQLGIEDGNVLAEVKPEQKAEQVKVLQRRGVVVPVRRWRVWGSVKREETERKRAVVAMVGDGINDSPALAQSDVGRRDRGREHRPNPQLPHRPSDTTPPLARGGPARPHQLCLGVHLQRRRHPRRRRHPVPGHEARPTAHDCGVGHGGVEHQRRVFKLAVEEVPAAGAWIVNGL
ncbi:E1-E2 ATPase-domain-containing protein [Jimgerdemannia flammicorona]|uniref:E1-E2 ATPase-domain-containing protein n=1 Tax=Jimgerdemannia flammicorona TaxID=994334 RepID=A0A433DJR6_9FUNG|nr:E1-E2 ATPase-domain-containing protein [Jimgerdemannia flammicorona]